MEKDPVTDYLIDADQKIPDWPDKTVSLGQVETAIRLGVKPHLGDKA